MKKVYLDNAATTPVDPQVLEAMLPYLKVGFGNPSSPHSWGQEARKAIERAREKVASLLGTKSRRVIFTSCATESINLAHKGLVEALIKKDGKAKLPHLITSSIEHKAVLETCQHLERLGMVKVTYLPVDKTGLVKVETVEKAIRPETVLVSLIYVNNEVGTIEPLREIGRRLAKINQKRKKKIFFHADTTQAIQYLNCQVDWLGVDLLSFSGHKLYAPKGIGALYLREGTPLVRQQDGGGQERHLRSGTENLASIVGLGKAIELAKKHQKTNAKKINDLRKKLIEAVLKIPGIELTGHLHQVAPHIASFVVKRLEGEALLLRLSDKGVAASSGSACTSGLLEPSHVLTAMGIPPEMAHGSIRFSLSKNTTQAEIDYLIQILPGVIKKLRAMVPEGI